MIKHSFSDRVIYLLCDRCKRIYDSASMYEPLDYLTDWEEANKEPYVCWRCREHEQEDGEK